MKSQYIQFISREFSQKDNQNEYKQNIVKVGGIIFA
jgi:hypothetical protein